MFLGLNTENLNGLNICGGGIETLQFFPRNTAEIVDVAIPSLTEIASQNICISKKFY